MSITNAAFKVLTEFQFEVAGAVANAGILERATQSISDRAQGALNTFSRLGSYITSSLGVQLGGLGLLAGAIQASENFTKNQLSFANIISSNMETLVGDTETFNDRLAISEKVLKNIGEQASKFSLDESSMLETSKMLSAMLAPKGLAGTNFAASINLARDFEKSAPTLGVNTFESQGQLVRMIEGASGMGDTLFRRLLMETKAFSGLKAQGGGSATKAFNSMGLEQRFELIQKAMNQFASDTDVLAGNAGLLSNQLTRLKNMFTGLNSILKPIGDVLVPKMKLALKSTIDLIDTQGRRVAESFARFIEPLVANPEQIYYTLKQLTTLRADLERAGQMATLAGIAGLVVTLGKFAMGFAAVRTGILAVSTAMGRAGLAGTLASLYAGIKAVGWTITHIVTIFSLLGKTLLFFGRVTFIVGFFLAIFQIMERAKAIADVSNLNYLVSKTGEFSEKLLGLSSRVQEFMAPLYIIVDDLAHLVAPLYELDFWMDIASSGVDKVGSALEWASNLMIGFTGGIYGLGSAMASVWFDLNRMAEALGEFAPSLMGIVKNVFAEIGHNFQLLGFQMLEVFERMRTLNFTDPTSYSPMIQSMAAKEFSPLGPEMPTISLASNAAKAFDEGMNEFFVRAAEKQRALLAKDKNVSSVTTNIAKVEIRQDFKENAEPDRIAVSLMKTLQAVALNPTQAVGNSLRAAQAVGGVR